MADYWKEVKADTGSITSRSMPEILKPSNAALAAKVAGTPNWAFVVAGFSMINVVYAGLGMPVRFTLGLCVIDWIYAIGHGVSSVFGYAALVVNMGIIGSLVALGMAAKKAKAGPFYILLTILCADFILLLLPAILSGKADVVSAPMLGTLQTGNTLIMGSVVHLFAFAMLFDGLTALKKLTLRKSLGKA